MMFSADFDVTAMSRTFATSSSEVDAWGIRSAQQTINHKKATFIFDVALLQKTTILREVSNVVLCPGYLDDET